MSKNALEQIRQEARREVGEGAADTTLALNPVVGVHMEDLVAAARSTSAQVVKQPIVAAQNAINFARKLIGIAKGENTYDLDIKDRRFEDPAWQKSWFYRGLLQSYLALQESLEEWVVDVDFNELDERRAKFLLNIMSASIAPTNTLLGNPAALRRVLDTGGANLKTGIAQLLDDRRNNDGMPSQVDKSKFEVGRNLATQHGAVVFKNEMLELIQYTPVTSKVYKRPLMVIPAPINKFYVFDLSPEKSFFKFCLEQGIQLFTVSWRNPSPEQSHWGLDDYINSLKEAQLAILKITRCEELNLYSPCSGGIISSILMAHLQALGESSIHSLTLPVCVLIPEEEDSDMTIFVSESSIETSRKKSKKAGVLRGSDLARVFNWMRPNDLIWNYVVNNYLMGTKPPAFDILYWNGDTTNLPAQLHHDFLDIMLGGALVRAGETIVCGTAIDLGTVEADKYIVAGTTDHLTPWRACYRNTEVLGKNSTFVLSSSGHIQCLINPLGNPKSRYYVNEDLQGSADQWLEGAEEHNDSWWVHWVDWLKARSGEEKSAPKRLGNRKYVVSDSAPGTYVFDRPASH
ncbi:MAG: polyhydroxyalkanoate synthase [Candidatus Azotimanducaceae bacterium]|jgi:polyhydroxyalkanoate synthase